MTASGNFHNDPALLEKQSKFPRYNMKCRENLILHEIFRVVSRFPATFHVISQKVDYLWDSVPESDFFNLVTIRELTEVPSPLVVNVEMSRLVA